MKKTIRDEYIKLLSAEQGDGYFLYDIDRNGTPELWIKTGEYEAEYMMKVYTYKNGVKLLYSDDAGHTSYYQGNGYILSEWGHQGFVSRQKLTYNGTSITSTTVYEVAFAGDEDEDEAYHAPTEKYISLYSLSNKQPIMNAFKTD